MASELQTKTKALWAAVIAAIEDSRAAGQPLEDVAAFIEHTHQQIPVSNDVTLAVLELSLRPDAWGAQRGEARLTALFVLCCSMQTVGAAATALEGDAWALADLFTADPTLGGRCDDTVLEQLVPEGAVLEPRTLTATVELSWKFDFVQP